MTEGMTCYARDEVFCDDQMCLRTGCRLQNKPHTTQPSERSENATGDVELYALRDLIASHIDCEEDCQSSPNGCGCALTAARAVLNRHAQGLPSATQRLDEDMVSSPIYGKLHICGVPGSRLPRKSTESGSEK